MKAAVMQPYFFPYLGYFSLIKHTDQFILFDPVQFIKNGWIERNRILKPDEGWQYIIVSLVSHSSTTKIMDIKINNNTDWKIKIIRQLDHYRKRAPYFKETMEVLKEGLNIDTESIVKLNEHCLKAVCRYLGISTQIDILTEMDIHYDEPHAADEWSLNICKALGNVDEYWNPEGGTEFFHCSKYEEAGIKAKFLKMNLKPYVQKRGGIFEPGLSILDVMMFNSVEAINNMMDDFIILPGKE